jgi:hypothetical protein
MENSLNDGRSLIDDLMGGRRNQVTGRLVS